MVLEVVPYRSLSPFLGYLQSVLHSLRWRSTHHTAPTQAAVTITKSRCRYSDSIHNGPYTANSQLSRENEIHSLGCKKRPICRDGLVLSSFPASTILSHLFSGGWVSYVHGAPSTWQGSFVVRRPMPALRGGLMLPKQKGTDCCIYNSTLRIARVC